MTEKTDLFAGGNFMSLNLGERKTAAREVSVRYKRSSQIRKRGRDGQL